MSDQDFNALIQAFEKAIQSKKDGKLEKENINQIYEAATKFFDVGRDIPQMQLDKLRDKWVELAEGHIDKSGATKKLQGTSRPEAIRSVCNNLL